MNIDQIDYVLKVLKNDLQKNIELFQVELRAVHARLDKIEKLVEKDKNIKLESSPKKKNIPSIAMVDGFRIRLQNSGKYKRWYASRNVIVDGKKKRIHVYIGKDWNDKLVRDKIQGYLAKHPEITL